MHHDRIALADLVEHAQGLTARQHVVLAEDLEPVDRRITGEDFVIMLMAKSEPKAEEGRFGRAGLTVCKRRRRRIWQSACDVHVGSARTMPDPEIITE